MQAGESAPASSELIDEQALAALEARGFSSEDVDKIMGRNMLRALRETENNAG